MRLSPLWREAVTTYQHPIATPVRRASVDPRCMARVKTVALQAAQTLSEVLREALFAYAMTGSAVASLAILAAPHLEVLLRCVLSGSQRDIREKGAVPTGS